MRIRPPSATVAWTLSVTLPFKTSRHPHHIGSKLRARIHDAARSGASSTSHSVAALRSRTNIPLAAGRAQDNETILERRHLAMDRVGSSTWIRQGS